MTPELLFELKIKNPNRPQNSGFVILVLFALLIMLIAPFSHSFGFMFLSIFFLIFTIYLTTTSDNQRDATFQIIQLEEDKHLIQLLGSSLDFKLEGELSYELWRKPTESRKGSYTYNVSNLSIFAPDQAQILIKSGSYNTHNTWGVLRGASPYPIGILIEMNKSEIEAIKLALEEHNIIQKTLSF